LYFDLRTYDFESKSQQERFMVVLRKKTIPALNTLGVDKVGVFTTQEPELSLILLVPHSSIEKLIAIRDDLLTAKADLSLPDPMPRPIFRQASSSVLRGFDVMPNYNLPTKAADRVFQLRVYESPSAYAGKKKIEMFQQGELDIFHRVGLNPVFFAETLIGAQLPSLTYMLAFRDMNSLDCAWELFRNDSVWDELSNRPEYSNELLIRNINNKLVFPTEFSQM
jgi:hypothetical protein|tara:strand:- start:22858 stop:23526 length:669 start_codon:yes stop_codon:yes gene_type:complete